VAVTATEPHGCHIALKYNMGRGEGFHKLMENVDAAHRPDTKPRDVFAYFIHEGKIHAPAAAMALKERIET